MSACRRIAILVFSLGAVLAAQPAPAPSPDLRSFLSVDAPVVALVHARVVDGTGAPAREDQTLILRGGRIEAMGAASTLPRVVRGRVVLARAQWRWNRAELAAIGGVSWPGRRTTSILPTPES